MCLNLCSLRWPRSNLSLVRYLIPTGSCTLKIEFCIGLPIFNNEFLNVSKDLTFRKLMPSLFHSNTVHGKKEYLNRSVLQ